MQMKRVEADTLEEAYSKAAKELSCSVTEINYEIVQYPTSGMMGLFKKTAIIIAVKKTVATSATEELEKEEKVKPSKVENSTVKHTKNSNISITPKKKTEEPNHDKLNDLVDKSETIVDNFFTDDKATEKSSERQIKERKETTDNVIYDDDRDTPENKKLSIEIEKKIQALIKVGCFEIDTVEVDVFSGIAHIFIDGDDAALLIGKEGYRYNALSYMLFNWINAEYNLYIKLEIAEFIQAQEEMIDNYLKPIAVHIKEHGKGKTKPLDGILVQIALEKLRAMFPNKYIAIKTGKDGKKFIIINDFNSRKN